MSAASNPKKSAEKASQQVIDQMAAAGQENVWARAERQQPQCGFGQLGLCCRHCFMGPCRIDPFGDGPSHGICGADANTFAARAFARMIAAGTAAHSDHGRGVVEVFIEAAQGKAEGYEIKDLEKLHRVAADFGIETKDRKAAEIALELGEKALQEFGKSHGTLQLLKRAPAPRQKIWKELGVEPRAIDREVVEIMHRTTMGVDQDYRHIMQQGARCALADGWGGSMIATDLQDIMFGTPKPLKSAANLGVLEKDHVNIIVHGHEPLLSEMIVAAVQSKEMQDAAKKAGAKGITLAGICCTANEVLMRHGMPIAGSFLQQELAVATGAVEAMIVDVQCIMQGLNRMTDCYHTKLITTSQKARIPGAINIPFDEAKALQSARQIVQAAIDNFPNRKGQPNIPQDREPIIAGFTDESIRYTLGGSFRASWRPFNDNVINGRIRGVAGVVGCCNPKYQMDDFHVPLVKELIANDVLVVQTGCSAIACGKAGLLTPEAAIKYAGPGLKEVCAAVGIPPVLHCGACVDNSRILIACCSILQEGGLGQDISDLPAAGAAPEWMSEKAIAIGQYVVSSGIYTLFGIGLPVDGAPEFRDFLFKGMEELYGGMWDVAKTPQEMAQKIIDHIEKKRDALGINVAAERKLLGMEERRALSVD